MGLDLGKIGAQGDLLTSILDNLHEGVYVVDLDRTIRFWNRGAERITGYRREEVLGSRCYENILRHVDECGKVLCFDGCPLTAAACDGRPRTAEIYLHHRSGHRIPVSVRVLPVVSEGGDVVGAVETFTDKTVKSEFFERMERLERERFQDGLTGVGNREFMEMKIAGALADFERYHVPFGVLFADIDRFKQINDRHGHRVGDDALGMVARTMSHALRAIDVVARWGGEEFLVLLPNVDGRVLTRVAERLRMLIARSSVETDSGRLRLTVSVGGTLAHPGDTVDHLVQRADREMYACKRRGRNRVSIDPGSRAVAAGRRQLVVVA